MQQKVRINQGRVLLWQFRLAGTVFLFMLIFGAFLNLSETYAILAAIALSFLLPPIWSSYYILEIDPEKNQVSEILWITGYAKRDITHYESIENIFINPIMTSQKISSYSGHVNEFKNREFAAFLKLSNGKKFELLTNKDLKVLEKKLHPIAKKLQCEVFNYA